MALSPRANRRVKRFWPIAVGHQGDGIRIADQCAQLLASNSASGNTVCLIGKLRGTRKPPEGGHLESLCLVRLALVVALIPASTIRVFPLVLIRLVAADGTACSRAEQRVVPEKVSRRAADCRTLQATRSLCRS